MPVAANGVRALLVASSTAVAGDHSLLLAVVTGMFGLLALAIGPVISDYLRQRLPRKRRRSALDHAHEETKEQELLVTHILSEVTELRQERDDLERDRDRLLRENDRLRSKQ